MKKLLAPVLGMVPFVFGVIPVIALGLLAGIPLLAGFGMLFDYPDIGMLCIVWAVIGMVGAISLMRVAAGRWGENSTLGLLAGITAAAPLAVVVVIDWDFPESLLGAYWTVSPILVACWYLGERCLKQEE